MLVVVSARGDRLASAPADWLGGLWRGAWWLRASVFVALPIVYVGVCVSAYGFWLLTRAQPGRVEPALDRGYRVGARVGTMVGAAMLLLLLLGAVAAVLFGEQKLFGSWDIKWQPGGAGAPGIPGVPAFDVLFLFAHAMYLLGLLSAWRYLRIVAQRAGDRLLTDAWRRLERCWVLALVVLVGMFGVFFGLVSLGWVAGRWETVWLPMAGALGWAGVLLWLWAATWRVVRRQWGVMDELMGATGRIDHR